MTLQFRVGETYATRSIGDHDCIFAFTILARTAKTVTVDVHGKTVRRGLYVWNGVEQFRPFGTYSMCAIIGADDREGGMTATKLHADTVASFKQVADQIKFHSEALDRIGETAMGLLIYRLARRFHRATDELHRLSAVLQQVVTEMEAGGLGDPPAMPQGSNGTCEDSNEEPSPGQGASDGKDLP